MKKKVSITLDAELISIKYSDVLKKHIILCEFISINPYQLAMKSISIQNNKTQSINLTSVEIRNINLHTLNKRSIKLINSYLDLDQQDASSKLTFLYFTNKNLNKLYKILHKSNKTLKKQQFLSLFSYVYVQTCLSYETNISKILSKKLGYSQSYIKNLIKESFNSGFLKNSSKGLAGGILTSKSINSLKQLHLI